MDTTLSTLSSALSLLVKTWKSDKKFISKLLPSFETATTKNSLEPNLSLTCSYALNAESLSSTSVSDEASNLKFDKPNEAMEITATKIREESLGNFLSW